MKTIFIVFILLVVGIMSSCQKENMDILVSKISVDKELTLEVAQTMQLKPVATPEAVTEAVAFKWTSSDPEVATVDESGCIVALKKGNAAITVELAGREAVKAVSLVTVVDKVDHALTFEDPKFAALVLFFDKNNDGVLQESEAGQVKELNVSASGIKSLKGIEYFTSLEKLYCPMNALQKLDVSKNTRLTELICSSNMIDSLDVDKLPGLRILNCRGNRLSEINVSHNPELTFLSCGMNNGSMYDGDGIVAVDVSLNPKLEVLDLYYLNLSHLDVTKNPKLKKLDFGHCCHTLWNRTPIEEIDLGNNPELEDLNCISSNVKGFGLNRLDVSKNPKLKWLTTYGNPKISRLDLSKNTMLKGLNCCHNSLTELDVTNCPLIDTLACEYNAISVLDLSKNKELVYLNCANNRIEELNFSNTKLGYLLGQNNQIRTVNMGNKTFDTPSASGSGYDNAGKPYLYMKLNGNQIESIDLSKQTYLQWIEINNNRLTTLDISHCPQLGGVHCTGNRLTQLILGEGNRMWELHFGYNNLSGTIDLSVQNNLSKISCEGNPGLATIYVWPGFKADEHYYLGGTGSLPCYTKDAAAQWSVK